MHDLAEHLNLPLFAAHGIMEMLWHYAGDYAPDGDIGKLIDYKIARAVGWKENPDILINALVETHWLDRDDKYRLIIHDWPDHAQDWIKKKLKRIQKRETVKWLQVYDKHSCDVSTLEVGSNKHSDQSAASHDQSRLAASTVTDQQQGKNYLTSHDQSTADHGRTNPTRGGVKEREVRLGKGNSSSGIVVVDIDSSQNGRQPKPDFTIRDWFERQYARHPNKRDKILGEQQISEHIRLGKITMADCERVHIAWCESEDWRWKNGAKVKQTYAQWISDEGYRYMPNGHAKTESPYETPEQMREREAREQASDEAARAKRRETKAARKETSA